jgi:hypothetical protein
MYKIPEGRFKREFGYMHLLRDLCSLSVPIEKCAAMPPRTRCEVLLRGMVQLFSGEIAGTNTKFLVTCNRNVPWTVL